MEEKDMGEPKYHLTYKINPHPEGLARAEIPKGWGATHALFMCSMIFPPDGSLSTHMGFYDGRQPSPVDDPANDIQVFKVWMLMAKKLSESKTLGEGHRLVAETTFDVIRRVLLGFKPNDEKTDAEPG